MPNAFLFPDGEARTAKTSTPNLRPDAEIVHPPVVKLFNLPGAQPSSDKASFEVNSL